MPLDWLFVVQNFEVRNFEESAANVEIIEPLIESGTVNTHDVLCFNRHDKSFYQTIVREKVNQLVERIENREIVLYGAGVHTQQYFQEFSRLNITAIIDRDETLWGTTLNDIPIISLDELPEYANHVLISSKAFEDAISETLSQHFPLVEIETIYRNLDDKEHCDENMYQSIITALSKHNFDIVFYSPTHPNDNLSVEYWLKIKSQFPHVKYVTLWWDYDEDESASHYLSFERDCLRWSDLCIENSNGTRLEAMRKKLKPYHKHTNVNNVEFIPTVFSKRLFYKDNAVEKKYEIALFGSAAGNRKHYIDKLKKQYGDRFWHLGGVEHTTQNAKLTMHQYAEAIRASKIVINTQTYPFREQCKGKVRETLACGVLLLEEDNCQTRLLLDHNEGVVYFKDFDDLVEKINVFSADAAKRRKIESNGQRVWRDLGSQEIWSNAILQKIYNNSNDKDKDEV